MSSCKFKFEKVASRRQHLGHNIIIWTSDLLITRLFCYVFAKLLLALKQIRKPNSISRHYSHRESLEDGRGPHFNHLELTFVGVRM